MKFAKEPDTSLRFSESQNDLASSLRKTFSRSNGWHILSLVLLAAAYFAAARFGLSLASVHTNVSPVWPPTGIALAAVLLFGYRVWPGILVGAFLANFLTPVPVAVAGAIAVGNTAEALAVGGILQAIGFRPSLERVADVLKFVVVAVPCTMISATIGSLSLILGHTADWSTFGSLWATWWLGDLTGATTIAPLLLTWSIGRHLWLPKRRYIEATALILLLSLSSIATFGKASPAPLLYQPLSRLLLPFLLWAGFRLGRRGVTIASVVVSAFAIWGTAHGTGPFIGADSNQSLIILQLYLSTNAISFLFLSVVVEEKHRIDRARHSNEQRLAAGLAISRVLAESPAFEDASRRILQTVSESLRWEVGAFWMPDDEGKVLRSFSVWREPESKAVEFEKICCERVFEKGVGLPGRVWETEAPAWIPDVARDDNFPRAPSAVAEDLHGAFAFPIMFADRFLGVMEFFSHEIRQPDPELLEMFDSIGKQFGQFIERKRAEAALAKTADALLRNEERLRLATQTGKVGVWDWDIEANRVSWTESLYQIHGVTNKEFDGSVESFTALIHPDDRELVSKAIDQSLRADTPYQLEFRAIHPDGQIVSLFTTAVVLSSNGKPSRMVGATLDITDLKRAEQALRDSEARYRSVIQALPAAVYTTDVEGRITMFNDAAVEFSGRTPTIGTDEWCVTWKLFWPDGTPMPHDECPMAVTLKTGEAVRGYEAVAERPDGTRVHFVPYPTPLHDSDGNLAGAINMLVDITDRKKIEEALRMNSQELSEFFQNATEAIHWVGADGTILRANQAEMRMLGYDAEDYIGRNIAEFHVDQDAIADILKRVVRGETLENYSARMRRKDGTILSVVINSSPYFENGKFVHSRCFTRDVTQQLETEKTLRHFAAIVETTDDAIVSKDLNGIITSWNRAAERLFGYSAEEIIGKPVSTLIPKEHPDEEPAILKRLRRGERIDHYETVRVKKDGRRFDVSLTVSPIKNAEGKIIGASKIARDISDQKRAQKEIAKLLASEREAREEAEIANRSKDEFLAVLSHEMRTPLTAMLGWLTILRGHKLDAKTTKHAIETVERNAKAQAQLIEDLVDISRIVGGKLNLEVRPIDVVPVIEAALDVIRPAAEAKQIHLDLQIPSAVPPVSGDPARLQQVIWNLLSNAVKFTPKGGEISVVLRQFESSAEIVIRDNGIGISPEFLPFVFERFRQAESAATRSHRGMGLGLAIVRHLIELHGGTVIAESEGEDKGSTFTIRLPLAAVKYSADAVLELEPHTNGHDKVLEGVRILLVEDEPDASELIALVLTGSGAQVEAVESAGDALRRMPLFIPDILLSDIGLPVESGYDLIRKVRSLKSKMNKVPAIALTAFATESDRKKSLSSGFQAHLAKPVEPSNLVRTIKSLVNGKS
ncbi:MAG TPA: PAS domain S-box protein [Pyrinomonadaceae bacterium]|nr:PAS domain S-box protein [Pyrinomonadaceae bacterium]